MYCWYFNIHTNTHHADNSLPSIMCSKYKHGVKIINNMYIYLHRKFSATLSIINNDI